jgi:hypothetical protein
MDGRVVRKACMVALEIPAVIYAGNDVGSITRKINFQGLHAIFHQNPTAKPIRCVIYA